jgi:hypothetical protein
VRASKKNTPEDGSNWSREVERERERERKVERGREREREQKRIIHT